MNKEQEDLNTQKIEFPEKKSIKFKTQWPY